MIDGSGDFSATNCMHGCLFGDGSLLLVHNTILLIQDVESNSRHSITYVSVSIRKTLFFVPVRPKGCLLLFADMLSTDHGASGVHRGGGAVGAGLQPCLSLLLWLNTRGSSGGFLMLFCSAIRDTNRICASNDHFPGVVGGFVGEHQPVIGVSHCFRCVSKSLRQFCRFGGWKKCAAGCLGELGKQSRGSSSAVSKATAWTTIPAF